MITRLLGNLTLLAPFRGYFARSVLTLAAANAAAVALSSAAYPALTRIYRPDQLGILSSVLFAVMILSPLATLRYEMALPLCPRDGEARSVLVLCFATVFAIVTAIAIVLLLLPASMLVGIGPAAPYRMFVPVALLAFGAYNVLVYEASRVGRYGDLSRTRVSQAIFGPLLQIVLGASGAGTPGLLLGFTAGLSSGTLGLARTLLFAARGAWSGLSVASVFGAAVKYAHFAIFSSWAGVLQAASMNMGNVVFTSLYGATIGGYLFLGDRVLMQPLRISGNAFLQVFVGEAGKHLTGSPTALHGLFVGVIWKQAAISAAWLGAVYLSATFAIPFVFGHSWAAASEYIDIMLLGYFPTAVAIAASHTLLLMRRQALSATLDFLRFVALVVAIVVCVHLHSTPVHTVLIYSLTQGLTQCLLLAVMYAEVRRAHTRANLDLPTRPWLEP